MCPLPRDVILLTSIIKTKSPLWDVYRSYSFFADVLWFTSWQVWASIFASAVAPHAHTRPVQFTFHRFSSLKLVRLGGGSRDSQRVWLSGRPPRISHCWFICWMPPYMSWDSQKEADVASSGWREHTCTFGLLQILYILKYIPQEFNLLVQNKREICATAQNFALGNTQQHALWV